MGSSGQDDSSSNRGFINGSYMSALGQQPTFYRKFFDWLLCEVKQPFGHAPGDRRLTAVTSIGRRNTLGKTFCRCSIL